MIDQKLIEQWYNWTNFELNMTVLNMYVLSIVDFTYRSHILEWGQAPKPPWLRGAGRHYAFRQAEPVTSICI